MLREGESNPPVCFVIILRNHIEGVNERALVRFTALGRRAVHLRGEVNVVVTSDREMRNLNRCFRGHDQTTDVLSFPSLPSRRGDNFAGDIVISAPLARQSARNLGHPLVQELKILILHGLLHLVGYDHEGEDGKMARTEARLRSKLRLPIGLIERARPSAARVHKAGLNRGGRR